MIANYPSQRIITVCIHCLTEGCRRGVMSCPEADGQTITDTEERVARLTPSEAELARLAQLDRHGDNEN